MDNIEFEYDYNISKSITEEFKLDISSRKDLTLFWVVPYNRSDKDPMNKKKIMLNNESDIPKLNRLKLNKINIDRFSEDIYVIDFSVAGIENISLSENLDNGYNFQLDQYRYWSFYYIDNSNKLEYKVAFELDIRRSSVEELTRNILLVDLGKYLPRFNFHKAYKYDSNVSTPLYQHYHNTYTPSGSGDMSDNVIDGRYFKSKLLEYINSRNSLVDNESRTKQNESYISNNKVHIVLGNEIIDDKIITKGKESDFTYMSQNGSFTPNANLFNAFDNRENNEINSEYDKYPLMTIYGVDSVASYEDIKLSWSLLVYELEDE